MTQQVEYSQEESALFSSDEFRMYSFKVLQCDKRYCHDWSTCPFAHSSEKAKRRDPRCHAGVACPAMKSSSHCPRGDNCKFAHNTYEYWLHPSRYRTHLCNDGANCKRKNCFFAHSLEELRDISRSDVMQPLVSASLNQPPPMSLVAPSAAASATHAPQLWSQALQQRSAQALPWSASFDTAQHSGHHSVPSVALGSHQTWRAQMPSSSLAQHVGPRSSSRVLSMDAQGSHSSASNATALHNIDRARHSHDSNMRGFLVPPPQQQQQQLQQQQLQPQQQQDWLTPAAAQGQQPLHLDQVWRQLQQQQRQQQRQQQHQQLAALLQQQQQQHQQLPVAGSQLEDLTASLLSQLSLTGGFPPPSDKNIEPVVSDGVPILTSQQLAIETLLQQMAAGSILQQLAAGSPLQQHVPAAGPFLQRLASSPSFQQLVMDMSQQMAANPMYQQLLLQQLQQHTQQQYESSPYVSADGSGILQPPALQPPPLGAGQQRLMHRPLPQPQQYQLPGQTDGRLSFDTSHMGGRASYDAAGAGRPSAVAAAAAAVSPFRPMSFSSPHIELAAFAAGNMSAPGLDSSQSPPPNMRLTSLSAETASRGVNDEFSGFL